MMMMMVHPPLTPADEHTRSKRERGKKIISTRTIPPSSALLPWIDTWRLSQRVSIIQYPEILPLRSTPKANISRPSKYIPYISHAHPIHLSLRKEEDQRTIITNDRSIHAQKRTYHQHLHLKIHPHPTHPNPTQSKSCSPPSPSSSSSSSSSPPSSPPPKNSP